MSQTDDAIRGQQRYSYDSEGRLTSAERYDQFSVAEYFNYDQADNLQQPASNAAGACLKHNRLRQWQQGHYEYDGWGNLIRHQQGSEVQHFVYDDDNQLINAYGNGPKGSHQTHYAYDGLGRRISKRVQQPGHALKETQFIWQGLRLLQEKQAQQTTTYVYDPNEAYTPLARIVQRGQQGETIDYFHTDLNGMPLDVTDAQGNLIWSAKYSAWGKVTRQNHDPATPGDLLPESHQPLRYPGQYGDDETGLHYNMFRYYDPNVGRFTTPDPIGLAGGINLYQYAPNPLTWTDPLGLSCSPAQLAKNKSHGKAAEAHVLDKLNKNPNVTVLGTQVYVKTPGAGRGRYVDILIQNNKTGKIIGVEVKSGGATRNAAQQAKDKIIASGKGIFGKRASDDMNGIPLGGRNTTGVIVSETNVPLWGLP